MLERYRASLVLYGHWNLQEIDISAQHTDVLSLATSPSPGCMKVFNQDSRAMPVHHVIYCTRIGPRTLRAQLSLEVVTFSSCNLKGAYDDTPLPFASG